MDGNSNTGSNAVMWIIIGLVVIVALAAAVMLLPNNDTTNVTTNGNDLILPTDQDQGTNTSATSTSATSTDQTSTTGAVKSFTVTGSSNFRFTPAELRVKRGDTVKVTFVNASGFHDWVLDEFNVKTSRLQAGQQETIEFVANRSGTFEYYCSVGTHRQQGMVGKLIVE